MAAVTFGAICDRYIEEETARTVLHCEVVSLEYQESPQATLGRVSARKDPADGGRGLVEEPPYGPEVEGPYPKRDAPDVSSVPRGGNSSTSSRNPIALVRVKGGSKRRQRPTHSDCGGVRTHRRDSARAVAHDGTDRPMSRSSRERDRGASMGRLRFRQKPASRSAQLCERQGG